MRQHEHWREFTSNWIGLYPALFKLLLDSIAFTPRQGLELAKIAATVLMLMVRLFEKRAKRALGVNQQVQQL
jgi:hypothetical protein